MYTCMKQKSFAHIILKGVEKRWNGREKSTETNESNRLNREVVVVQ